MLTKITGNYKANYKSILKVAIVLMVFFWSAKTHSQIVYNPPVGDFYYGTYTIYSGSLPAGLVSDAGSNVYRSSTQINSSSSYNQNFIMKIGNYWFLGRQIPNGPYYTPFSLDFKCPIATTDNFPPCNCVWTPISTSNGASGQAMKLFTGDCVVWPANINLSTTLLPGGFVVPSATTAIINATPNPLVGTLMYDLTSSCLKIYNGSVWGCI
jgi:hypothetical protein